MQQKLPSVLSIAHFGIQRTNNRNCQIRRICGNPFSAFRLLLPSYDRSVDYKYHPIQHSLSFAEYHLPNYDYLSNLRSTLNINNSLYYSNQTALSHTQLFRLNYSGSFINNNLAVGGIALIFFAVFIAISLYQKAFIAKQKDGDQKKNRLAIVKRKIYGFIIFPFLIGFFVNTYISLIIYCLRKYEKADSNKWIECISILVVISSTMIVYFKEWRRAFIGNDILHR